MYLKSLALKGFKSFADRSVLTLQPGITAIVGPNGSGKSNISDAVLWVLGERSARNLRGQAMDDIIFSGSAARRAVSVAEVDLVLDNSDYVLPVEFDEVVITRRMYRSGESEYLVNGVVARRLDVLDILHDSGLGTGTHSIISQGSLDSILQSKTEDRRALIEEAAGILKHKRRKEKSARKIALMDTHLTRVRDVTAEVERQLKPLERKAKKAQAYKVAHDELISKKLELAVDDLRTLQKAWDEVCAAEAAISTEVEAKRGKVESAEQQVVDFQEIMKRDTEDAGIVSKRQRRAASLAERLDSVEMLARERKRAAIEARADMTAVLDGAAERREAAEKDLGDVRSQLAEVAAASEKAQAEFARLTGAHADVDARHRSLRRAMGRMADDLSACNRDLERAKQRFGSIQKALANGMAQVTLVDARKGELSADLDAAREALSQAQAAYDDARCGLKDIAQRESDAQKQLVQSFAARDEAHEKRDEARRQLKVARSEIEAIEKALVAGRLDEPAINWALSHANAYDGGVVPVTKAFRVESGLEALVEGILGEDLDALSIADARAAKAIADALAQADVKGDLTLVMSRGGFVQASATLPSGGRRLVDELSFDESAAPIVEALLGDVVLCEDRAAAFAAHENDDGRARFASLDGCVVWPTGKVRVYGPHDQAGEGTLARERRLAELRQGASAFEDACEQADSNALKADEDYRSKQAQALKLSQQLANARGAHDSAASEVERIQRRVDAAEREIETIVKRAEAAAAEMRTAQETADAAQAEIDRLTALRDDLVAQRAEKSEELGPVRQELNDLSDKLSAARLESAKLAERQTYVERLVVARERDVADIVKSAEASRTGMTVKAAAISRCDELLSCYADLAAGLQRRLRILDEAVSASEAHANDVHERAARARDAARSAHDEYDQASARMAQVRVEKGRLEMRVEAAVKTVVQDLGTPIDRAQELPLLKDRATVEDDVFKLERRIKNMGAINPDAADEYAQLKERYDYLAGQLSDMEAARASLRRIVNVIDARMRDDFVRTFSQVNENFDEIFSTLFPGGTAHLSFEDPDDIENTGVEVTAQPRGKRLTKMMLMSGGEKSLTALALLFAVYKTRSTPFYILDEVEAALDDTNLRRLTAYINTLRESTQLIMITHQRRTMEMADVLFGVSMQADGVTKVISQKLERALEHAD